MNMMLKVEIEIKIYIISNGDVAFKTVSDVALKSDIEVIPNALDKIDKIKGYTFKDIIGNEILL